MKKILQKEAPVLREICKNIPLDSIQTPKIQKIIKEMKEALASQNDGVAIAAPQIGYPVRIFVVSKKVKRILREEKKDKLTNMEDDMSEDAVKLSKDSIYINPTMKKMSKEKKTIEEGCLSVRYLYGKVSRSNKATVSAWDENGNKFERGGTGILAQIFQHEMDHLDGILFIDKAKYIEEVLPPKTKKNQKND